MGGVFISYRRDDSQGSTGRIADRLHQLLGDDVPLFVDIDSIRPGQDFREVITNTLAQCDVTLVMIGPRWTEVTDDEGNIRLENSTDLHRLEVESALGSTATTIPVLVEGATMPAAAELPASIRELAYLHAAEVSVRRFGADAEYLAAQIRKELDVDRTPAPEPPTPAPDPPALPAEAEPSPELPAQPAPPSPAPGAEPSVDVTTGATQTAALRSRLILAGGAIAALLVVIGLVVALSGDSNERGNSSTSTVAPTIAVDDTGERIGVFDLAAGDCFDAITELPVADVSSAACTDLHHNEVFSVWSSFSATLPADDVLLGGCESRFEDAVGRAYALSSYWIDAFWPDEATWAAGTRTVICFGFVRDGAGVSIETTGSMLGSGN